MKKWLLAAGLGLALATSAQAADKIAIVNMGSLFQQVAQRSPTDFNRIAGYAVYRYGFGFENRVKRFLHNDLSP